MFILFYALHRYRAAAFVMIISASLFFYAYWSPKLLFVIITSIAINYGFVKLLHRRRDKLLLGLGITINLGILGYYKYTNFIEKDKVAANLVLASPCP